MELELLLDLETIESKGSNINALTLVGKILSDKKINFTAINTILPLHGIWCPTSSSMPQTIMRFHVRSNMQRRGTKL